MDWVDKSQAIDTLSKDTQRHIQPLSISCYINLLKIKSSVGLLMPEFCIKSPPTINKSITDNTT